MSQPGPTLLDSSLGQATHDNDINKFAPPRQAALDIPTWTPLKTLEDDESSSDSFSKVDDLAARRATGSPVKRPARQPTDTQAIVENTVTAGQTTKLLSVPKAPKKALFDGVLITTKPPPYRKLRAQTRPRPTDASSAQSSSLVDALARSFNANRHTGEPFHRQSRPALRQYGDRLAGPQTDVETTEAEEEQLQLNTRLARSPLKKQRVRARIITSSANVSETNSEDTEPRPVKRLKPVQYEVNPALIDAALETVQAPINWDAEMDFITRDEDFVIPAQIVHITSADVRMTVEEGDPTISPSRKGSVPSSSWTPAENGFRTPTWGTPKKAVLSPYLSRGTKFRQRLDALFGENATVRTDRVARPRPVDLEFFVTFDEPDREASPGISESTNSASSAFTTEEVASAVPSTHITSQSPDILPINANIGQLTTELLNEADSSTKPTFSASEEQMNGWIAALQRLVKGKVRAREEDLETLDVILAEIESVKDSLDGSVPMITELQESVKRLSELYEIPFGDRNKLRLRAENIVYTWLSMGKPGAP